MRAPVALGRAEVKLTVRDDGVGFVSMHEPSDLTQAGHFGLVGMSERAESAGGSLDVHTTPRKGVRVMLQIPLQP